jgi:hypothetical protein
MPRRNLGIDVLAIKACMRIALPGIDAETARRKERALHGLAESGVGVPGIHAQFDE